MRNFHLSWEVVSSKRKSWSRTITCTKGFGLCWLRLRVWFSDRARLSSAEVSCLWSVWNLWCCLVCLLLLNWSNLHCVSHKLIDFLLDLSLTQRRTKHGHIFYHLQAIVRILFLKWLVIIPFWLLVCVLLLVELLELVWFILLNVLVKLI